MNSRVLSAYHINHCPLQAINIPKICEEDTTLTIGNANGEKRTIPISKGIRFTIDTPGLHYNRENPIIGTMWTDDPQLSS